MKYRKFGKLDWKVSSLGFGAMRLPIIDRDAAKVDEIETIKMIRYAINHGINYVDTAYPYHRGNSEIAVGKALRDGYRERVRLATKMPTWLVNSQVDMDKYLDEQLKRLQVDYVDFYLLHGLRKERWPKLKKMDVFKWAEKTIKDGRIRHLGFSFHDEYELFKEIIDSYDGWTMCQIQYNYLDTEYQAGLRGLKYASSNGLAVVVMEPIAGGTLSHKPSSEIKAIWDESKVKRSPAEWALQWVWNQPEVSVALSGMSAMSHVVENVKSANRSGSGKLSKDELDLISRVREKYRKYGLVECTSCRYCMPCPQGVKIPEIFSLYNEYFMRNRDEEVMKMYGKMVPPNEGAKQCIRCGKCEELCPQKIPIRNVLVRAASLLEDR